MYDILKSTTFDRWLSGIQDRTTKAKIEARIRRLSLGNLGQSRLLKDGIRELKINYGSGYRVYYTFKGKALVLLLCGGDKSTQSKDIKRATRIAEYWEK